jgi:uncharacterized protein
VDYFFADSSAVLKLYVPEVGSSWMLALDRSGMTVSALAFAEIASALRRRLDDGSLTSRQVQLAWRRFRQDLRAWVVIDLTQPVLDRSARLLFDPTLPVPLRALDALQLASALEAQLRVASSTPDSFTLLTADERLFRAATHLGVDAENPNLHP